VTSKNGNTNGCVYSADNRTVYAVYGQLNPNFHISNNTNPNPNPTDPTIVLNAINRNRNSKTATTHIYWTIRTEV